MTAREKELAKWVVIIGGRLTRDEGPGVLLPNEARFSKDDFERFQDLPHFYTLAFAGWFDSDSVWGSDLGDNEIFQLRNLPKLRHVGFRGKSITDRSLEHLARFPLVTLYPFDTRISGAGISGAGISGAGISGEIHYAKIKS